MQSVKADQTEQTLRLIGVLAGHTSLIVGFVMRWLIHIEAPISHIVLTCVSEIYRHLNLLL